MKNEVVSARKLAAGLWQLRFLEFSRAHGSLCSSNSKTLAAPLFHHYKLAQQWPPTICRINPTWRCISQIPNFFTVHGLWPSNQYWPHPSRCSSSEIFVLSDIQNIGLNLNLAWPNLFGNDGRFWEDEWDKHGVCSTFIPMDYFQHTMTLWFKYNITNMLVEDGVTPGAWYTRQQIMRAIEKKTQASPDIVCRGQHLQEIHVCLDPTTATTFVACPRSTNCRTMIKF
ncbi:uncharacterized protein [Cicer arietinum]|uniref:uncharacterized protein isoform X2 n=1 Tax=Cicer arietinum TaxID=3827 RepID=UPI003CC69133